MKAFIPMADATNAEVDIRKVMDDVIDAEFNNAMMRTIVEAAANAFLAGISAAANTALEKRNAQSKEHV